MLNIGVNIHTEAIEAVLISETLSELIFRRALSASDLNQDLNHRVTKKFKKHWCFANGIETHSEINWFELCLDSLEKYFSFALLKDDCS